MSAAVLPGWADILVSLLLVASGLLALIGTLGLWRFESFYQRMHGPTLVTTLGTALVLVASMLFFSLVEGRLSMREWLIAVFVGMTVPITTMVLARAALYRHRRAGKDVPDPGNLRGGASGGIGERRRTADTPEE